MPIQLKPIPATCNSSRALGEFLGCPRILQSCKTLSRATSSADCGGYSEVWQSFYLLLICMLFMLILQFPE